MWYIKSSHLKVVSFYLSACEIKINSYLFERLSEINENGVFSFERSSLVSEIFKFLCYGNEESD